MLAGDEGHFNLNETSHFCISPIECLPLGTVWMKPEQYFLRKPGYFLFPGCFALPQNCYPIFNPRTMADITSVSHLIARVIGQGSHSAERFRR